MSKEQFINELTSYLKARNVIESDIKAVVEDYKELYGEAQDRGLSDVEIFEKLGTPRSIYLALRDTLSIRYVSSNRNKIVAVSPFVAIILFFIIGLGFNLYDYAWMSFLLIPISAILINVKGSDRIISLTPFISIVIFMITGFLFDWWHPMWLIFFSIPISAIILKTKNKDTVIGLSPFVITIIYFLVAVLINPEFYRYGFAMYALIPIIAILLHPLNTKRITMLILIVLAVFGHLFAGFVYDGWSYSWAAYLVPVIFGIIIGDITFESELGWRDKKQKSTLLSLIVIVAVYFAVSYLVGGIWNWSWIILLLFPMASIYIHNGIKHPVSFMPFIATITFMILGTFFGLWDYAWLVYLSIPIVAIVTDKKPGITIKKSKVLEEIDDDSI
ncbi:MAG: DUF1700 domain-containing protein [Acholeplasmataceae bacterium]